MFPSQRIIQNAQTSRETNSRPVSRTNRMLPVLYKNPSFVGTAQVAQPNKAANQKGMDMLNSKRQSILDQLQQVNELNSSKYASFSRQEIIKDIFKTERNTNVKAILKTGPAERLSHKIKFSEDVVDKSRLLPRSILKRKNSSSRDRTQNDIEDFFEISESALNQQDSNNVRKHTKHTTLQPIESYSQPIIKQFEDINLSPKKVQFNKQIQVQLIEDKLEPADKMNTTRSKLYKRHYTVADILK